MEDLGHGPRQPVPVVRLGLQPAPSRRGQPVEARPPVVLGEPPVGANPALLLEPVERRVERALVELQHVARQGAPPARRATPAGGAARSPSRATTPAPGSSRSACPACPAAGRIYRSC